MSRNFAILSRDPATAEAIQNILRLPDDRWTDLEIEFSNDDIATARVSLALSPHQLVALANLTLKAEGTG